MTGTGKRTWKGKYKSLGLDHFDDIQAIILDKLAELGREIRDGEAKTTSRRRPSNKTDKTEAPPPPPPVEEDGTKYKDDDVDRLLKSYGERPPSAVTLGHLPFPWLPGSNQFVGAALRLGEARSHDKLR